MIGTTLKDTWLGCWQLGVLWPLKRLENLVAKFVEVQPTQNAKVFA